MPKASGAANGNWNGGRIVDPRGYALVRVGKDHHLSDIRGYAYEHRLVAEAKLGRRLLASEQIHHVDGDKGNNDPENLEVMESTLHHQIQHRKPGSKYARMPGDKNEQIECACGCGGLFRQFDDTGRVRRYLHGHNARSKL